MRSPKRPQTARQERGLNAKATNIKLQIPLKLIHTFLKELLGRNCYNIETIKKLVISDRVVNSLAPLVD